MYVGGAMKMKGREEEGEEWRGYEGRIRRRR